MAIHDQYIWCHNKYPRQPCCKLTCLISLDLSLVLFSLRPSKVEQDKKQKKPDLHRGVLELLGTEAVLYDLEAGRARPPALLMRRRCSNAAHVAERLLVAIVQHAQSARRHMAAARCVRRRDGGSGNGATARCHGPFRDW